MEGKSGLGKLVSMNSVSTVCQRAAAHGQSRCGFALLHISILGHVDVNLFMFLFFSCVHNMVPNTHDLFGLLLVQPNVDV